MKKSIAPENQPKSNYVKYKDKGTDHMVYSRVLFVGAGARMSERSDTGVRPEHRYFLSMGRSWSQN